jgi:hypothetical protein
MKTTKSGVEEGKEGDSPYRQIDAKIVRLTNWRGETLARVRRLIKQANPEVVYGANCGIIVSPWSS